MNTVTTVPHSFTKMQPLSDNQGLVFCPMCEILHENNTLCQMPMEGDWS